MSKEPERHGLKGLEQPLAQREALTLERNQSEARGLPLPPGVHHETIGKARFLT
jgi:hypothetical protein